MIIAGTIITVLILAISIYFVTKVEDPDAELKETKAKMFEGMAK